MRDDESSHDGVFVVENERFPAHSCFMRAVSPVLRTMLTNGMKETNEREVLLKEVNVKVWKIMLDYIYIAKMEVVDAMEAVQVLECVERFQIEDLQEVIYDHIERELNIINCSEILVMADCPNSTELRAEAMKFIVENFHGLFYEEGFSLLSFELRLEVINCDKLVVRSELDVFIAVVRWFLWRTTFEVPEEPEDETVKRPNVVARKVLSLFVKYEFVKPN